MDDRSCVRDPKRTPSGNTGEKMMKIAQTLAYPLLLLLALWIPKIVEARLDHGIVIYSPVSGFDAKMPYFWYAWSASLILMLLAHGWSLRSVGKCLMVRMLVTVLAALTVQAVAAPHAHVLNNDTATIDAIAMFCTGFMTILLMLCWRSIRKDRAAS
jgi:hypothetical protein